MDETTYGRNARTVLPARCAVVHILDLKALKRERTQISCASISASSFAKSSRYVLRPFHLRGRVSATSKDEQGPRVNALERFASLGAVLDRLVEFFEDGHVRLFKDRRPVESATTGCAFV